MIFKNLFVACTFLFFGVCSIRAVNPEKVSIIENTSHIFRYDSTDDHSLKNLFVIEIARLNFLNLYRTEYAMDYDLTIDIHLLPDMKLEIVSRLENKDLVGDVFYKDFNVGDVMTPTLYSFELIVSNGHNLIDTIRINDLDVSDQNNCSTEISIGHPHGNLNIVASNVAFSYKETDKLAFDGRISAINDYMALSELSVYQLEKAGLIDAEEPGEILSAYFQIFDLERYLSILNAGLEEISFKIPDKRTQFLELKLKELNSNQRRLNTLFDQTLNSKPLAIDKQQLTKAAETITGMQLAYLDELNRQSFFYEPMYQNMAAYFCGDVSFKTVSQQLDQYFNFSDTIENKTPTIGEGFKDILIEKYLLLSDSLIACEKFHIAEILLESADAVCQATNSDESALIVYNKLSTTKWGIYDAYMRVAKSAMEAGNLSMAYQYLETASEFQSLNHTFITTNGFTLVEFEKLAWAYFEKGNREYKSELYRDAISSCTQSLELYRMLEVEKYEEIITKKIANAKKGIEIIIDKDLPGF